MNQRTLGALLAILGGAILIHGLASLSPSGSSGAYHTGQLVGTAFGAVLLLAGVRAVVKNRG